MKKIVSLIVACIATCISVSAQTSRGIYQKFSQNKGVDAVYVSPATFRLMNGLNIDLDDMAGLRLKDITADLTGLYILDTGSKEVGRKIADEVRKMVDAGKYELLVSTKDDTDDTSIYAHIDGDTVSDFVLLDISSDGVHWISIEGRIPMEAIQKMMAQE
ncbi:MAG: DUF4252 domain-containing protein [Candidatus Cryptobacteroides sp.]